MTMSEEISTPQTVRGPSWVVPEGYDLALGLESVREGWAGLVREAFEALPTHLKIIQVKEKFGALRIYTEPHDPAFYTLVLNDLLRRSLETCEVCGETGRLRDDKPWLRTLCDKHAAERKK